MPSTRPLDLCDVSIGVLTALPEEYGACIGIFDPGKKLGREVTRNATSGSFNAYLCPTPAKGGLTRHIVAITLMSDMGNNAAAIAANILMQHCKSVRFLIMCGVSGVTPNVDKAEDHVRRGDIVVSNSVIQYDRGKQHIPPAARHSLDPVDPTSSGVDGPAPGSGAIAFPGFELRSSPSRPSAALLDVVRQLDAAESLMARKDVRPWEAAMKQFLSEFTDTGWRRPSKDELDDSPDGSAKRNHPKSSRRRQGKPLVFQGTIAAANIVLANPVERDFLRDNYGVKAVEMEGSGVADASWISNVGYLIIRSGCDYCNPRKNKPSWRKHAALTAAAFARTVIENVPLLGSPDETDESAGQAPLPTDPFPAGHSPLQVPQEYRPSAKSQLAFETVELLTSVTPDQSPPTDVTPEPSPTAVDLGPPQPPIPTTAAGVRQPGGAANEIDELCNEIRTLLAESRFRQTEQRSHQLEELLKTAPRVGRSVKNGLILLARIESLRLQDAKLRNRPVDLTRLRALRQEIENVLD